MSLLLDPEFWARLASIIVIDLSLAGDNALVIALAVRSLPAREREIDEHDAHEPRPELRIHQKRHPRGPLL